MDKIRQCYKAYTNSQEYQQDSTPLDDILETAGKILPRKEYIKLEAAVNGYCDKLEESAFAAGFRFATRLWAEGMK